MKNYNLRVLGEKNLNIGNTKIKIKEKLKKKF